MALFPAYETATSSNAPEKEDNPAENETWLTNSSFPREAVIEDRSAASAVEAPKRDKKIVKHKPKKHKTKHTTDEIPPVLQNESEEYVIDRKPTKEYLSVKTISRPAVSRYSTQYYIRHPRTLYRKYKFKRYYQILNRYEKSEEEVNEAIKADESKNEAKRHKTSVDEYSTDFKQEKELSELTGHYNSVLASDPNNIEMWLKYVEFQDTVYAFEKTYKKGSVAKGQRVYAERKLAIIDKALMSNPNSESLLREKLNVLVSVYPADELQLQLKTLVEKDQANIILWQGYIEATQCSMSHCNSSSVMSLYSKCLSVLHKIRRSATIDKSLLEEQILRMLYQCGLFLKQAGLFEQLWTLLKMYLELNLSEKFDLGHNFNEKQLMDLEELIFKSQLPIHELWLRTEKLRESCHWLPLSEENCEDPQRLVFPEDVAELIHPITMPENTFKLIATILTLLKVPLLPCRHTLMNDLGLDYVPWAYDSIETILPVFLTLHGLDLNMDNVLCDSSLAVGPQYLKVLPGQEEYTEFILTLMRTCIARLRDKDKTAVTLWWFRFQRVLLTLDWKGKTKMSQNLKKRIKSDLKNFLKMPDNRSNSLFYSEYAQIEGVSSRESCNSILQTAYALSKQTAISATNVTSQQVERCHLTRILVENTLILENEQKALAQLVDYGLEGSNQGLTPGRLHECELKFKHVTTQLLAAEQPNLTPVEQFLPNFFTDWVICHAYFTYLTKGAIECGVFLENTIESVEGASGAFQREVLYEVYVAIIFKYCRSKPGFGVYKVLDDVLHRAIKLFPNNIFLLSVLYKEQADICFGHSWWTIKKLLTTTGHSLPVLFLIHIAEEQGRKLQDVITDTITGQKIEINVNFKNRMLSMFRSITKLSMCTRRCGLVWRLYLQFVYSNCDPTLCRNVYYTAVEECPWLKALYIDAAIYIPGELAQIQDLIIEKQLRLHVTPEELDVLRT